MTLISGALLETVLIIDLLFCQVEGVCEPSNFNILVFGQDQLYWPSDAFKCDLFLFLSMNLHANRNVIVFHYKLIGFADVKDQVM